MKTTLEKETDLCGAGLSAETFRRDVLAGLSNARKSLPCKYLYDDRGAQLFEAICELEEYYPTRTELGILRKNLNEISRLLGPRCTLVDLGSGSGLKTRLLLDALDAPAACILVDVARSQLLQSSARLAGDYPALSVLPVCSDYTNGFALPTLPADSGQTVAFFPGSTIGNFEPDTAVSFLRRVIKMCGSQGGILLGVDLKKNADVLHSAYNDAQGVTAAFNLNLLARANRELGARFDLSQFRHRAIYRESHGRIEMHLVSRRRQRVPVDGTSFVFAQGEFVVTEHSYKYTLQEFRELAARAGLEVVHRWTDERQWFSVFYLKIPEEMGGRE